MAAWRWSRNCWNNGLEQNFLDSKQKRRKSCSFTTRYSGSFWRSIRCERRHAYFFSINNDFKVWNFSKFSKNFLNIFLVAKCTICVEIYRVTIYSIFNFLPSLADRQWIRQNLARRLFKCRGSFLYKVCFFFDLWRHHMATMSHIIAYTNQCSVTQRMSYKSWVFESYFVNFRSRGLPLPVLKIWPKMTLFENYSS